MATRGWSETEKRQVIRLYEETDMTLAEIGAAFNVGSKAITRLLKRLNVTPKKLRENAK